MNDSDNPKPKQRTKEHKPLQVQKTKIEWTKWMLAIAAAATVIVSLLVFFLPSGSDKKKREIEEHERKVVAYTSFRKAVSTMMQSGVNGKPHTGSPDSTDSYYNAVVDTEGQLKQYLNAPVISKIEFLCREIRTNAHNESTTPGSDSKSLPIFQQLDDILCTNLNIAIKERTP